MLFLVANVEAQHEVAGRCNCLKVIGRITVRAGHAIRFWIGPAVIRFHAKVSRRESEGGSLCACQRGYFRAERICRRHFVQSDKGTGLKETVERARWMVERGNYHRLLHEAGFGIHQAIAVAAAYAANAFGVVVMQVTAAIVDQRLEVKALAEQFHTVGSRLIVAAENCGVAHKHFIKRGGGVVGAGVLPRLLTTLALVDPESVMSSPSHVRLSSCVVSSNSNPLFSTAPRFEAWVVDAPADGGTMARMSASLVVVLS